MGRIIQLTKFSGQDGANQLANYKIYRCDSVVYCKSQAEATCYRAMIEHFGEGRKGVDHLYGTIAICVDPSSTMIEGMHLISIRIPSHIKSSYPFQLQAKKIGEEKQAEFLEACGLISEKELKAVWDRCANRLTFPIEATVDEKNEYAVMFDTAQSILRDERNAKKKMNVEEVNQAEDAIMKWLKNKFGEKFKEITFLNLYTWKKVWRISYSISGHTAYTFCIEMDHSQENGVEGFSVSFIGLSVSFTFPWSPDKNITAVISRLDMMWEQFNVIMAAVAKARNAATVKITVI